MSMSYIEKTAAALGENLEPAVQRFGGNVELYARFLKKFPQDPTADALAEAVRQKNYPEVERSAHTLKGVAANLGLETLRAGSDALVQAVRRQSFQEVDSLYESFAAEYARVKKILEG